MGQRRNQGSSRKTKCKFFRTFKERGDRIASMLRCVKYFMFFLIKIRL
jgi:hypothetical protein